MPARGHLAGTGFKAAIFDINEAGGTVATDKFGSLVLELARNSYFNGQALRINGAIRMPPR